MKSIFAQRLSGKAFVVASHSEPYLHLYEEGELVCRKSAGGLVTALDPVMSACGGTWVAAGGSGADREVVDEASRFRVSSEQGDYWLKRAWLDKDDEDGYLDGFSNSTLWPLCHFCYVRPRFEKKWWDAYQRVNRKFANAILEALDDRPAFVWVQDYQLALVSKYLKEARPDVVTAQFWHIPWPVADVFKICPWHKEILEALLYNDLLGFHINYYALNFLDTVDQSLEARVDLETRTVFFRNSETKVRSFPISIDYPSVVKEASSDIRPMQEALRRRYSFGKKGILLGVDRRDYTKGIPEKFMAFGRFLERNPLYRGKATLVQVASPTRVRVPEYKRVSERINGLAERVNWQFGKGRWKPIVLINDFLTTRQVVSLYRMAEACIATPLHDGMNLVAKEYAASRIDDSGVLLLSKFTGAARELKDAVLVNPYSLDELAESFRLALSMPAAEQRKRMARMRGEVRDNDVFRWAADFIEKISKLESTVIS